MTAVPTWIVIAAVLVAGCATPTADRRAPAAAATATVIVCLGTSTTAGYGVPADASYVARLRARAAAAGAPLTVVADGHGGWSTADFLAHADAVVAAVPADAAAIVLQVGTNDVRWPGPPDADAAGRSAARVEQLVARCRARAPRAAILLVTPTAVEPDRMTAAVRRAGFGDRTPARLLAVTRAYRSAAARLGWRLVDVTDVPPAGHTHDGLHPDALGHARIADVLWAALTDLGLTAAVARPHPWPATPATLDRR